jgi:hypothetical protein
MKRFIIDRIVWLLMLAAVLMGVTACQSTSGSFCAIAPRLYYHQQVYDAMNDAEARNTLTYQRTGERLCRWKKS